MIESREQRKAKTLLHRRKVGIIVSLIIVSLLLVSSVLVYNYFTSVYYFTDADGVTKYSIKKVDGVFGMYDANGNILPTEKAPGSTINYYVTEIGTLVDVDAETGEYTIGAIPDLYYTDDGETLYAEMITIFKGIESAGVRSIEINNQNGSYTLFRYDFEKMRPDDTAGFVLKHSPLSTLKDDLLSYLVYYAAHPLVKYRLEDPIVDGNGEFSEYGLVPQTRYDAEGNAYDYTPNSYTVTTTEGIKHTIFLGDRLIDGSGYYIQYMNNEGVRRPTVYVFNPPDMSESGEVMQGSIHNTLLGADVDLVDPKIVYPMTNNDYFDVTNFKIQHRNDDGKLQQIVALNYIPMEDRENTVAKNQPYVFAETSFKGYTANSTNIDGALLGLMAPKIEAIKVLAPSNDEKVEYNLMTKTEVPNEDGTVKYQYSYSSKYIVEFDKVITDNGGGTQNVRQTLYVSEPNENGNYYVFTEIRLLDAIDDSPIKGISLDSICEVSAETMDFVSWDQYRWIYPNFLEANIMYTDKIEISTPSYSASFDINYSYIGDVKVLNVIASDSKGQSFTTFGSLSFTDYAGNKWVITPERIYVTDIAGREAKPGTLHFEYNDLGEQVHVIDSYARTSGGDLVYVTKNEIKIQHIDGTSETYLRYHNSIFKELFLTITTSGIIDSCPDVTPERELEIVSNPANKLMTIKIYDTEGGMKECSLYSYTKSNRKCYLMLGAENPVGGFCMQTNRINKIVSDCQKFFDGIAVDHLAYN